MHTWTYPGWTQGSDNEKIREEERDENSEGADSE